jgi:hypothetical protein
LRCTVSSIKLRSHVSVSQHSFQDKGFKAFSFRGGIVSIFSKILERSEFTHEPPILLDIGASGSLHEKWKEIAKFSICIAFDADDRETNFVETETENYRKLYVFNRIVTDRDTSELDFYLTKSPYCSSALQPDQDKIKDWEFAELFAVEKTVRLRAVTLKEVLKGLRLNKIDWFKTDSQGTDLRLFRSLGEDVIANVLAAEFEPGIVDVYRGEDKLHHLMSFMEAKPFWLSDMRVLGLRSVSQDVLKRLRGSEKVALQALRTSPNWAELTYLNSFSGGTFSKRDHLLGCIFAIIERQFGFALGLSLKGYEKFQDGAFRELERFVIARMMSDYQKQLINETLRPFPRATLSYRLLDPLWSSALEPLRKLRKTLTKSASLTIARDHSNIDNQPFLKAECQWFWQPQFRFWGKKSEKDEFILLADWSTNNTCRLLDQYMDCVDYGVHVRSGNDGDWQNQAWIANDNPRLHE